MKAIMYTEYGLPDVLHLEEVDKPTPKDNEVLIKVKASSVNDWDWGLLRAKPFVNRLSNGLFKPKKIQILGADVAGQVESVGVKVKQFKPGDEVFGDLCQCGFGCFAEYVCAPENALTLKPGSMSFEQAAAVPQAGLLALRGLRKGKIRQGQKVLINGASGGAGSFAVQMAKSFGAEVTGVCRTGKLEFVKSLGADKVIDFQQEDFTKNGQFYDLILDMMAFHSIFDYKCVLSPKGVYIAEGGSMPRIFQVLMLGPLISIIEGKKMSLLIHKPNKNLAEVIALIEAGKIIPAIDKCYPLSEAAKAMRYFGEGHKKGKIVITMEG
ncbi:MAG: NAD(P)-dependent alcohol dehydrogenase [Methylococcales bacterium]|nr:NAD(P)-dependent alcohol dehydrogenase [Methylococcales bacterium]